MFRIHRALPALVLCAARAWAIAPGTFDDFEDGTTMSWGGDAYENVKNGGPAGAGDQTMQAAIGQAEENNSVVVAAAGNEANNNDVNPDTPCTLPNGNLICVAAVTRTGARSGFSNFGATTVDLGAPGGDGSGDPDADILSAKPAWAPLFSEDFQSGTNGWTASHTSGTRGTSSTSSGSAS